MASTSSAATTAAAASPATLPYPNVLQARHTTDTHRRVAADAVQGYRATLSQERGHLRQDDAVLSEEEAARLQRRADAQKSANAAAAQYRQRACDVVASLQAGDEPQHAETAPHHAGSATRGEQDSSVDVFHAACDGDVGALQEWCAQVPPGLLPSRINAVGQPDPATYSGVQFQQRWFFQAPPLVLAAAFGREAAVEFLLAHGADPEVRSSTGLRAIDYAVKRNYDNIAAMLRGESS